MGGLAKLSHYLISLGPFGLLAIAFLDSVLVPMPGGVDAVLAPSLELDHAKFSHSALFPGIRTCRKLC